jgi:vacuolar-type H+-ATPase subunit I/STV1
MGLAIGTGIFINKQFAEKQYNKALDARDFYSRTATQSKMDEQKAEFESRKKKYENLKSVEYGIYGASSVLFVNYIRILLKQRRTPVPQFKEKPLLTRIHFNAYPDLQNKSLNYCIRINF